MTATAFETAAWAVEKVVREDLAARLGGFAPDAPARLAWLAGFAAVETACIKRHGADLETATAHRSFVRNLARQLGWLPDEAVSGSLAQQILADAAALSAGLLALMEPAGTA